jgi:exonuclease III
MFSIITLPDAPKASPENLTSTVVCIQGITTNNFTKINGAMKKLGYTHIHTSPQKGKEWEGIYSKVKIESKGYVPFTRTSPVQTRGVIWIKIIVNEMSIVIATSRLESMGEGSALRKLQLD